MQDDQKANTMRVLREFGVIRAWVPATTPDANELIILLSPADYARIDVGAMTTALMNVILHTKVWVTELNEHWDVVSL